jgi:hypothetical protein
MKNEAYDKAVNELKEVAAGTRGWVSLTKASRQCGERKEMLAVVAKALGLVVTNHGAHGMCARREVAR